jgi:hypothetical protein
MMISLLLRRLRPRGKPVELDRQHPRRGREQFWKVTFLEMRRAAHHCWIDDEVIYADAEVCSLLQPKRLWLAEGGVSRLVNDETKRSWVAFHFICKQGGVVLSPLLQAIRT